MNLSYDFDIHWLVPRELFSDAQADAYHAETGERPEVRGHYQALFRNADAARALMGADKAVQRFFEAAGFGFNVYDSGAPEGRYPVEDEPARIDVIERIAEGLGGFNPGIHELNGFEFEAFLEHLARAEPWAPAAANTAKDGRAIPALPLAAAAVTVAVVGAAMFWQQEGELILDEFDTRILHTRAGGGE